ncbi:MAG: four-carbon acid sugar kinase family protein, partial [Gammaproteobacteria bacterium]|nr:four-carbon acid sugar kinase family protein [Gammaproteobacteria bacterium]
RTVYQGHLFVGTELLSDSPMKDHPLTPMRDANLVRVLGRQTRLAVGLVPFEQVEQGASGIRQALDRLRGDGRRLAIVDAVSDEHLRAIGEATVDMPLVTGGSGIALGIPQSLATRGVLTLAPVPTEMPAAAGFSAVLAGSCSTATRAQIEAAIAAGMPARRIDPEAIAADPALVEALLDWARSQLEGGIPLIYSSAEPEEVARIQSRLGVQRAGALIEQAMAEIAAGLVALGVTRLIVAGGETSGAVVERLGVRAIEIGPEIDPGVPWTRCLDDQLPLVLALKSGNFGAPDFFIKAWQQLS